MCVVIVRVCVFFVIMRIIMGIGMFFFAVFVVVIMIMGVRMLFVSVTVMIIGVSVLFIAMVVMVSVIVVFMLFVMVVMIISMLFVVMIVVVVMPMIVRAERGPLSHIQQECLWMIQQFDHSCVARKGFDRALKPRGKGMAHPHDNVSLVQCTRLGWAQRMLVR
jgi:hypothetical protein